MVREFLIKLGIFLFLVAFGFNSFAQKPVIDTATMSKWTSVYSPGISDDGKYAFYTVDNKPLGSNTLVVVSTDGSWQKEFVGASAPNFSWDSKALIYTMPNAGIFKQSLGRDESVSITTEANSYQLIGGVSNEWVVFQKINGNKALILHDIQTGAEKSLVNVESYIFSLKKDQMAFIVRTSDNEKELKVINLYNYTESKLWRGSSATDIIFDNSGEQIAFMTGNTIVYYKQGMSAASELINGSKAGIKKDLVISAGSNWRFSVDGKQLFFDLQKVYPKPKSDAVQLDVWSYQDEILQSVQLKSKSRGGMIMNESYLSTIDIDSKKLTRLVLDNESVCSRTPIEKGLLVENRRGNLNELYWNRGALSDIYLVSSRTGKRTLLLKEIDMISSGNTIHISPGGRFIFYYNVKEHDFFAYEIKTGKTRNITGGTSVDWWISNAIHSVAYNPYTYTCGTSGWVAGDQAILINSKYDIWRVDPLAEKAPQNLTHGDISQTVFRLASSTDVFAGTKNKILLRSFNMKNKNAGFYELSINKLPKLTVLFEGAYTFSYKYPLTYNPVMIKAKKQQAWIVLKGDAKNSYNFYFSKDLKNYERLSNIHPERTCNWITSELHTVPLRGSETTQGILYKPDNFNPQNKYPVIIYYYEDLSNDLNKFQDPQQVGGVINIPHFVSNGYLVFTPDIAFRYRNIGESALNTVESCAKYLANLPFVDGQKIGINGASFGGYETNYIVTHSKMFAAAISGAGAANTISAFGTVKTAGLYSTGMTDDPIYYGVDKPYWENLAQHIDASPIFSVQNVTTPLLLFHNKDDGAVPFHQGIEFFIALRRLGKKAWLLQYDNEDHGIYTSKTAQFDLETRYIQFFDHYLKGKAAPIWMTRGIPAKLKGIDDGLDLDTEIKTPGEGLNIRK